MKTPLNKHYSGPRSREFWRRVNAVDKDNRLYELAVLLQNLEGYVHRELNIRETEEEEMRTG